MFFEVQISYIMLSKRGIYKVAILFTLLLTLSCKENNNGYKLLTLQINNTTIQSIQIKDIFSQIDYIFLETLPECLLIESDMEVFVTGKYIIANNKYFGGNYLFDRKTGKFLYEIGKKGQGPGEYYFVCTYPFNEKYELFYVERFPQKIGIDINTNKVAEKVFKEVRVDSLFTGPINNITSSIDNIYKMDSSYYIAFQNNITGNDPNMLVIFDKEGNILKTYPNHQKYVNYDERGHFLRSGFFYEFDNQLFFKEYEYNDTVFKVNLDTIIPHIVLDLGKKKPDYTEQENPEKNKNCYWVRYVRETTKYIFFSFYGDNEGYYDGYYKKENGEMVASLSSLEKERGFVHENNLYPPFYISNINQSEEIIGIIKATDMLDYIEKNKLETYPDKFNSLKFDDNPIIVVATLK